MRAIARFHILAEAQRIVYEYRRLSPEERSALVEERRRRGYPPHSPPHPVLEHEVFLLTAACYQHVRHMEQEQRRRQLLDRIFEQFISSGIEIRAWVILPNHYHLLVHAPDFEALGACFSRVHGPTAVDWNREDGARGRKVWYRFSDRAIRSERHYCTTLNYIHYNPVKHGCVESPYEWGESSVHWYLAHFGREWLRDLWARYPLRAYGEGWDDA